MLSGGLVLLNNAHGPWVSAREKRTGSLRWSTDVQAALLDHLGLVGVATAGVHRGVVEEQVAVYAAIVTRLAAPSEPTEWLVALDLATGALLWAADATIPSYGVVGDGEGRYASRGPTPAQHTVHTATGAAWTADDDVQLFAGGRAFGQNTVRAAATGAPLWSLAPPYTMFTFANDDVALTQGDDAFRLVDARTGALLPHRVPYPGLATVEGTFPVGPWAQALLADDSVLYLDLVSPSPLPSRCAPSRHLRCGRAPAGGCGAAALAKRGARDECYGQLTTSTS
jgi:hypothetical protein